MQNIVVNNWVTQSAAASTLTNDLVAYWPLNEASGTRSDSHSNSLDLTDNNTVGQGTGNVYSNAADFEENNSEYLTRSSTDLLQPLSFSISMWIKPEDLSGPVTPLISKDDSMESEQSYILYYYPPTNKLYWAIYENDGAGGPGGSVPQASTGSSPMSLGSWYHIVVTLDDQNESQLILNDGTPFTASVTESMYQSSSDFGIGAQFNEGSPVGSHYFDGLMEAVSFHNRVLTAAEITSLYNLGHGLTYSQLPSPPVQLKEGLVAYWPMNEASGTRSDSHSTLDLTDNNSVTQGTGNTYANASDHEAGNSEYLSHASASEFDFSAEFSMVAWVKAESLSTFRVIAAKWSNTSTTTENSYLLWYRTDINKFELEVTSDGTAGNTILVQGSTFGAASTATWYMVYCYVNDADNEMGISVNNGGVDTATYAQAIKVSTSEFRVGAFDAAGLLPWDGLIGPFSLYDRPLKPAEVTALYNSGSGLEYSEL